ncbi:MAG TPA: putative Ig domain-containing protein [Steroidobacteraceae bacterium]|nr:putative Ig domain-containing protein [Steroidobacteraceae bacterium]
MASNRILRGLRIIAAPATAIILCALAWAPDAVAAPKECRGAPSQRSATCTGGSSGGNQAPVIQGTPSGSVTVGEAYAFVPTASDPEGATLSFSIGNKPPWASFSTTTGRLSGTPTAAAEGVHVDIVIRVSDGKLSAELPAFDIEVTAGNAAPTISGTPPTSAQEGQAYSFRPAAADPDGDLLSFTIANRPPWASFDPQTGRLYGTPGAGTVGVYRDITIRVSDGTLVSALPAYSISVEQASLGSATLSWTPPTQRIDGTPLENLAGYRIRYGTAPGSYTSQLQIPNPGITSCVIENLPPGTYYFVAIAYDAVGLESAPSAAVSKTIG